MSKIDIEDIEEELKKRLYYENKEDEKKYKNEYNKIHHEIVPNDSKLHDNMIENVSINESKPLKDLKKTKLMNIRKNLNDDEGFNEIKEKLPDIKNMIKEKKNERKLLPAPKPAHVFQRAYASVTGKKNNADIAKDDFVKKKEELDIEIARLETIKTNIENLSPIYNFQEDTRDIELQNKDVIVTADDMVIGKTYKFRDIYSNMVTLMAKSYNQDNSRVKLTFSDGGKMSVLLDYNIIKVAQEGGKRKTRRQRKSRNMRGRKSNRRR